MRFGCFVAAFIKIGPDFLPWQWLVVVKSHRLRRYFEIERPVTHLPVTIITVMDGAVPENGGDLPGEFFRHRPCFMGSGKQSTQDVAFEVPVGFRAFTLHEKLHTTVFPDRAKIFRIYRTDGFTGNCIVKIKSFPVVCHVYRNRQQCWKLIFPVYLINDSLSPCFQEQLNFIRNGFVKGEVLPGYL